MTIKKTGKINYKAFRQTRQWKSGRNISIQTLVSTGYPPLFNKMTLSIDIQLVIRVPAELGLKTGYIMVKTHTPAKGGQTVYPATVHDAAANPRTRESLATETAGLAPAAVPLVLCPPPVREPPGYGLNATLTTRQVI